MIDVFTLKAGLLPGLRAGLLPGLRAGLLPGDLYGDPLLRGLGLGDLDRPGDLIFGEFCMLPRSDYLI